MTTDFSSTPYSAATSVYGSQRPTFSEDGKGIPYSSLLSMVGNSVVNQDISYDTSSKDPAMVRARVFIGNLGRVPVTRDELIDLFKPFGKLLALTFFKVQGYAFVQFSEPHEADAACTGLNGKRWKQSIIDVHLAMTGPQAKKTDHDSRRKRRYDDNRDEPNLIDETAEQNKRNRDSASRDATTNDDLVDSAMADTLICGSCRFVTCDFELFKDHRIAGCRNAKAEDEPKSMRCASCNNKFLSAWALILHLTDFHRMTLFRAESLPGDGAHSSSFEPTPAKQYCPPGDQPSNQISSVSQLNGAEVAPSDTQRNQSVTPIGHGPASSAPAPEPAPTDASSSSSASQPPSQAYESQWNPMTGATITTGLSSLNQLEGGTNFTSMYGMR